MRKGLKTTELRRVVGARTTSHVLFLDNRSKGSRLGVQLGLSVEPGLKAVPGPTGYVLDGYVVADRREAKRIRDAARQADVYMEEYTIPELPRLATALLNDGDVPDINRREERIVGRVVSSFLDQMTTGMSRGTHYNTREDQEKAEQLAHATLFGIDRQTYGLLACLNGLTDNARKTACWFMLEWPGVGDPTQNELTAERLVIQGLASMITPPRMFQLFKLLRDNHCNNRRTRRLILTMLLGSEKLDWWAVKYRRKMRVALIHAWGRRLTTAIASICVKRAWNQKEREIIAKNVTKYAHDLDTAQEVIAFLFPERGELVWRNPLMKAYHAAKENLADGRQLPPEVLEGLRSTYHSGTSHDDVLRLSTRSGSMTEGQKMGQQRRAERAGVDTGFNPMKQDAVKLYIYAFERGMSADVRNALEVKAQQAANALTIDCDNSVVLVDGSKSMEGDKTQFLRPMASALAISDAFVSGGARRIFVGGKKRGTLVRPSGDTSLALPLAQAIRDYNPSSVFVISDGYDNTPAGRFQETVAAIRRVGVETPIYHLNPVAAAETAAVRELAPGLVPTMPVQNPKSLGTSLLRQALEQDPLRGLRALLQQGQRALAGARRALPPIPAHVEWEGEPDGEIHEMIEDLSPTMQVAVQDLYSNAASPDSRGRIRYRGVARRPTVQALRDRGLLKFWGNGIEFIQHTDLGVQVAQGLR